MTRLRLCLDKGPPLVADSSVWINLAATGQIEKIVRTISRRIIITQTAINELESGKEKGRQTGDAVLSLASLGLVDIVELDSNHDDIFLNLVAGTAAETLDDGESATIAYAATAGLIAVIDERKATSLAKTKFPNLQVVSTAEILMLLANDPAFSDSEIGDAIFNALFIGRMRVPDNLIASICSSVGMDRLRHCTSIPTRWRAAHLNDSIITSKQAHLNV